VADFVIKWGGGAVGNFLARGERRRRRRRMI